MRDTKEDILEFWFDETLPQKWFQIDKAFDRQVVDRFSAIYNMAKDGLYDSWQSDAYGSLALCILLDQFPRNMFRGSKQAFATDDKARLVAKQAIAKGFDQILPPIKKRFIYLPFEHSEALNDQRRSVELFTLIKEDDPLGYDYAIKHLEVIKTFGRFPHRNAVLGRKNTAEEKEYLAQDGSGF